MGWAPSAGSGAHQSFQMLIELVFTRLAPEMFGIANEPGANRIFCEPDCTRNDPSNVVHQAIGFLKCHFENLAET